MNILTCICTLDMYRLSSCLASSPPFLPLFILWERRMRKELNTHCLHVCASSSLILGNLDIPVVY